ncbi:S-layer homology domain-containing protein [Thermanaeromonas toyohensis ToBE]|uniref:S-layer homology domain-containing protein n=1 Tax=Thermanaeromonas toyohensis ToBE TaxID=698762 RepID=A0A1W1VXV2_9FIRM|nr:N-acetylmuramoyl-L-alanine amidase [Thermanaeromonas toyohensis]SMB97921.1 S-layer homology domain-containing protein [Thermanaeromonas toyohensis ToBE]
MTVALGPEPVAMASRTPESIRYIVLHHSATEEGNVEIFRREHVEVNGWADIGYHFVICNGRGGADGEVQTGRDILKTGAHAPGRNQDSVGICLVGDFTKTKPTSAQILSLYGLIKSLMRQYPITPERILGHNEVNATACPGCLDVATIRSTIAQGKFPKDYEGHWAEATIKKVLELGLIHGYPDGSFRPDQPATRAELAAALLNLYQKLKG